MQIQEAVDRLIDERPGPELLHPAYDSAAVRALDRIGKRSIGAVPMMLLEDGRLNQQPAVWPPKPLPPPKRKGSTRITRKRTFFPPCSVVAYRYFEVRYVKDLGHHYDIISVKKRTGFVSVLVELGQVRGSPATGPGAMAPTYKGRRFLLNYQLVNRWVVEIWRVDGTLLVCLPFVIPLTRKETLIRRKIVDTPVGPIRFTGFSARLYKSLLLNTVPLSINDQIANVKAGAANAVAASEGRSYPYASAKDELWHGITEGR